MALCKGCIHDKVCNRDVGHGYSICPHYTTADVVPKSEVEMLQGALKAEERHNELTMEMAQKALANARAEVAREIFEEIERLSRPIHNEYHIYRPRYAELKKKYTESCTECGHFVGCEKAVWERGCDLYTEN